MADRTSAALFAELFEYLAQDESEPAREFAEHLWNQTRGYDFHPCQMGCDEALVKLRLAHESQDEPGRVLYRDDWR